MATQVAQAAGLKYASQSVAHVRSQSGAGRQLREIQGNCVFEAKPEGLRKDAVLFTEGETYQMLLRGRAPASEPFRKWVTEEALPSIRKTGKYNAEDSQNPIAMAIMDELKSLRGEIASLRQELQAKTFSLEAPVAVEVSPYEGQRVARQ